MEWSEVLQNKEKMIRPLYNKSWVKDELHRHMTKNGDYESEEDLLILTEYDGSIIVGRPIDGGDETATMMFGLLHENYLDGRGLLDYILSEMFYFLDLCGTFTPGEMESVAGLYYDQVPKNQFLEVLSYVIGESLSDPSIEAKQKINTKDCKEHLVNVWNYKNMKRTKKVKFGLIDVREFENEDGSEATILTYNGRIINSYPHTSSDYE